MVLTLPDDNATATSTWKFVGYGTLLGLAVDLLVYPAELLKTQLQVSRQGTGTFIADTIKLGKHVWSEEGLKGLYRGSLTYIAGGLPSQVAYFVAYKEAKERAEALFGDTVPSVVIHAVCGVIADLAATPVWVPVDIVSQRLQLQRNAGVVKYKDTRSAVKMIYKTDGIRGFFKGTGAAVALYAPASAIWWSSYEYCKRWMIVNGWDYGRVKPNAISASNSVNNVTTPVQPLILKPTSPDGELVNRSQCSSLQASSSLEILQPTASPDVYEDKEGSVFVHVVSGFISGSLSSILTNPLDIVKTRIQTQDADTTVVRKSKGVWDELTNMFKLEGKRAVFRGMFPRTAYYGLCSSATFVCYELAVRWSSN